MGRFSLLTGMGDVRPLLYVPRLGRSCVAEFVLGGWVVDKTNLG